MPFWGFGTSANESSVDTQLAVIWTVAEPRLALSGSATVRLLSMTTGPASSVKAVVPTLVVTLGASLMGTTLICRVPGLPGYMPSLAWNVTVRVAVLGLPLAFW